MADKHPENKSHSGGGDHAKHDNKHEGNKGTDKHEGKRENEPKGDKGANRRDGANNAKRDEGSRGRKAKQGAKQGEPSKNDGGGGEGGKKHGHGSQKGSSDKKEEHKSKLHDAFKKVADIPKNAWNHFVKFWAKTITVGVMLFVLLFTGGTNAVFNVMVAGISEEASNAREVAESNAVECPTDSSQGSSGGSGPSGAYKPGTTTFKFTPQEVEDFGAKSSVRSSWGVSDSAIENMFLNAPSTQIVRSRYNINKSNVGHFTKLIREHGVSPVFMYIYAKNEGAGAGGLINHFASDAGVGGPDAVVVRDANYITSQSQVVPGTPATEARTLPGMTTQKAAAYLAKMPRDSVGRLYVQATAATTAEIETLYGNVGSWSPGHSQFGSPIQDMMSVIKNLGGDLTKVDAPKASALPVLPGGIPTGTGSSSSSKSSSDDDDDDASNACGAPADDSTGADASSLVGIAKSMVGWFHYSQPERKTIQKDSRPDLIKTIADVNRNGKTDCSGFVWLVMKLGGFQLPEMGDWTTQTMLADATGKHQYLKEVPPSEAKAGTIAIMNEGIGHTAILQEDWKGDLNGNNQTKIYGEGGPEIGVQDTTFSWQFNWMFKKYGNPRVVFAVPVSTSSKGTSLSSDKGGSPAKLSASEESARSWIVQHESGGSYTATNGQFYGKYQLDLSYLHGDKSPANQERVAQDYVTKRYGTWVKAQEHWKANNWY